MTTTHDPVLAKVRKLLALAEDPAATDARGGDLHRQGDPADRRLRHRPGAARRRRPGPRPGRRPGRRPRRAVRRRQGRPARHRRHQPALRLRTADPPRDPVRGTKELSIHLFGHASDLERSELLFTSLLLQSAHGLARTPVPEWEHKAAFRRSWLAGFRMAVGRRLDEARAPRGGAGREPLRAGGHLHRAGAGRPRRPGGRRDGEHLPGPRHRPPAHALGLRRRRGLGRRASAPTSAARPWTAAADASPVAADVRSAPGTPTARHPRG